MSHLDSHVLKDGKVLGTVKCTECSWRWPCREESCGHCDCWSFKGKLPTCYLCHRRLAGENNTEAASWGSFEMHGQTRAACYCCRDQWARLPQTHRLALMRGYTFLPCDHSFEDKLRAGQTSDQELQVVDQ